MTTVYGIDLGTTFTSCAEVAEAGSFTAEALPVEEGQRKALPSEVLLARNARGKIVAYVGEEARKKHLQLGEETSTLAMHAKRAIGVARGEDGYETWRLGDDEFDAIDISALVLKKVKQAVERQTDAPLGPTVVTHPRDFRLQQKHATKEAARAVGIDLIDTIDEPVAGLYAFLEPGMAMTPGVYMIFDLGGGTLDIALMEVGPDAPKVIGGHGVPRLGGIDWDHEMVKLMMSSAEARLSLPPPLSAQISAHSLLHIYEWANKWKHWAKTKHTKVVELRFHDGQLISVEMDVNRRAWEFACSSLVDRAMRSIDEALGSVRLGDGRDVGDADVVQVVPIGGSTRLQTVRDALVARFGAGRVLDLDQLHVGVDIAVALGAARYASYRFATDPRFSDRHKARIRVASGTIATTTLPNGLNVLVEDESGEMFLDALVMQGATLPTTGSKTYEIATAGYGLEIALFEGAPGPCHPTLSPAFIVELPSELLANEGDPVRVYVEIGQSGNVERVRAEHVPSGTTQEITLKNPDRALDEVAALEARRRRLADIEVY